MLKLHGYLDWYKDLKNKKSKTCSKIHANFADTLFDNDQDSLTNKTSKDNNLVDFTYLDDFTGTIIHLGHSLDSLSNNSWIVDTGASNHMRACFNLLSNPKPYISYALVRLPVGSLQSNTYRKYCFK